MCDVKKYEKIYEDIKNCSRKILYSLYWRPKRKNKEIFMKWFNRI